MFDYIRHVVYVSLTDIVETNYVVTILQITDTYYKHIHARTKHIEHGSLDCIFTKLVLPFMHFNIKVNINRTHYPDDNCKIIGNRP